MRHPRLFALAALAVAATAQAREAAHIAALESIQAAQLLQHAEVLAGDAYEGRSSGTRGGRAAGAYLVEQLGALGLKGGAEEGGYFQPFPGGRRNVLAVLPGGDPELRDEWIVVGAHYDHVGYGSRRTSLGPIGYIHNGADDNASGVAALLELAQGLAEHPVPLRRSVLIAFWDGEELGMLGSKHWARRPTLPLSKAKLAINIDMVGRMREGRMEIVGSRTGYGLRRLASVAADPGLRLDFTWQLEPNSDHWTFIQRGVPTLMLHTGLHDDYHRPSDDVQQLNIEGIRLASRYLLDLVVEASGAETLPPFRGRGKRENKRLQQQAERPLPPLPAGSPPPRVGISWRGDEAEPDAVFITRVVPGTPAELAGLENGDRLLTLDGEAFTGSAGFESLLQSRLAAGENELTLFIERRGHLETKRLLLVD